MEFDGTFRVPGRAADVIVRFTDIARMARCMPGASLEGKDEEGNYIGVMTVAFGPKRIKFKGRMTCEFDVENCRGVLKGRGAADLRAARVAFQTDFTIADDPTAEADQPFSIVKIMSKAELGGVLADFARTGGTALANVLMREFEKNLAEELSREASAEPSTEAKALSAHKLVWSAVKSKFS